MRIHPHPEYGKCQLPAGLQLSRIVILLDSVCTVHIVTEAWLLDDYTRIAPKCIQWGNGEHKMNAMGRGTLVTRNELRKGGFTIVSFPWALCAPNFGINHLSFKQLSSRAAGSGVLFKVGATLLDAENRVMGYSPESWHRGDLYHLICSIVSGDTRK